MAAVMKFKDGSNVTLSGSGTLNITVNGKNGIKSGATTDAEGEASLTIKELTLSIDSPENDALNAEALLSIESGNITISAGDDAIHSDYTLNIGKGNELRIILDSTDDIWSGCAPHYPKRLRADSDGNVRFDVPRYSAAYYELAPASQKKNSDRSRRNTH